LQGYLKVSREPSRRRTASNSCVTKIRICWYAIRLLNQAPQGKRTIQRRRQPRYDQEVRQALVEAWKAARHICPLPESFAADLLF